MERVTWESAFSLRANGWNPYRATAEAVVREAADSYDSSPLKTFYERFRPKNAAEYFNPKARPDDPLTCQPPDAFVVPWLLLTPQEARVKRHSQNRKEERKEGIVAPSLVGTEDGNESDGVNKMGPVSERKGTFEFRRIAALARSIQSKGYRRDEQLDIEVTALRHKGQMLYVIHSGYHRAAVLAALGYDSLPVLLRPPAVLDLQLLLGAPLVKQGYWAEESLKDYIEYLFVETGINRARDLGIVT